MIPSGKEVASGSGTAKDTGAAAETRARVLVVDDVFENRDILTRRLVRRGFDVVEASGGKEALEKVAAETFDIVLLDIMMPDISGNDVLREIRKTIPGNDLPIIMVTAKSQSEDVAESLSLGANDYITKPVDFVVALARIKTQLERKRMADRDRGEKEAIEKHAAEEKRKSEEKLHYLAYHDALTGLFNRVAFREHISDALLEPCKAKAEPTVLFIDLDRFKAVNDVHGHETGDKLLQAVAVRLSEVAAEVASGNDVTIARLGGDEFGAFLLENGQEGAGMDLALAIVAAVMKPFIIDGQAFQVGASCGVSRASECDFKLESMLKGADLAMYQAKIAGRGRPVQFEARMLKEQHERNSLEVELRRAIQEDALDVYYQPLINTETNEITAFEALVRWPHPERGMVPPDKFIAIAEETGLIVSLGMSILRRACAEAMNWPENIRVAVNLSPLQFRDPDLLKNIKVILADTGLAPTRLDLDITESALLEAGKKNTDILRTIRSLGIRVVMDDFGTGYSSMTYLQNFEFDKIKIDQRFVRDLAKGPNGAAIIKAIVDLGLNVGIATTAEGIETCEELAAVKSHGCVEMQGYLFSKPMDSEKLRAFIEEFVEKERRASSGGG